jgi:hypothetical protein
MTAEDVSALAGLRRMVLHARDQLQATMPTPPRGSFSYGEHWQPGPIRRLASMTLAASVLTLVADCLPADGGLSPDEAETLTRDHQRVLQEHTNAQAALRDEIAALKEQVDALVTDLDFTTAEKESAEEQAEGWRRQWETLERLATTDMPAAGRYITDPSVEPAIEAPVKETR